MSSSEPTDDGGSTVISRVTKIYNLVPDWVTGNKALKRLGGLSTVGVLTAIQQGLKPEDANLLVRQFPILRDFLINPAAFILGIVFRRIISGILSIGIEIADGILKTWRQLADILGIPGRVLGDVGGTSAAEIEAVIATLHDASVSTAEPLGPIAPFVGVATFAITAYAVAFILKWLVLEALKWLT